MKYQLNNLLPGISLQLRAYAIIMVTTPLITGPETLRATEIVKAFKNLSLPNILPYERSDTECGKN